MRVGGLRAMVERVKEGWKSWVLQGIPAAVVLIGAIIGIGVQLGGINQRLTTLERMDVRIGSLESQVQSLQLQVQELKDELLMEKKVIDYAPSRRIDYPQRTPEDVTTIPPLQGPK
jgi:hypothetical protein